MRSEKANTCGWRKAGLIPVCPGRGCVIRAGPTAKEYWIDDELLEYVIPYGALRAQSHWDVLRQITRHILAGVLR